MKRGQKWKKTYYITKLLVFFQLVVMIVIRKGLDHFFTKEELRILDDILPSFTRRKQLDDEDRKVRNLLHNLLFH